MKHLFVLNEHGLWIVESEDGTTGEATVNDIQDCMTLDREYANGVKTFHKMVNVNTNYGEFKGTLQAGVKGYQITNVSIRDAIFNTLLIKDVKRFVLED